MKNYNLSELDQAFAKVAAEIEQEQKHKKNNVLTKIIVGVGILLAFVFLYIGKTNANNNTAAPLVIDPKTEVVIDKPKIDIKKTVNEYYFEHNSHKNWCSLWTIYFDAPYAGCYNFCYCECYITAEGKELDVFMPVITFYCKKGLNIIPNCIISTYAYELYGRIFYENVWIKPYLVVLKLQ